MKYFLVLIVLGTISFYTFPGDEFEKITRQKVINMVFCAPSFDTSLSNQNNAPVLKGLGNLHFDITTNSDSAQLFFDQGLRLTFGFNHGEAARAFRTALRIDSTCAMAYWGLAMVLGPNYNAPLNPTSLDEIKQVIVRAVNYSSSVSPREQALIRAIASRFPKRQDEDPATYYQAYAKLMADASSAFADDNEVATLYADALMNLHPWDLWNKDGTPKEWTPEILQVIERILARAPDHPGAMHYYIHATEASKDAAKALPYADKLRDAMPNVGHMVHMPSHTYIRTGQYHKGVIANEKASLADSTYISQCRAQGFYPLYLYPHNLHFLAACAFFEGNSKKAIDAAWAVSRKADKQYLPENVTFQHFYIIPYYLMVHFGKWNDILTLQNPGENLRYPSAMWHYARGMANANQNNMDAARDELLHVIEISKDPSLKQQRIWDLNTSYDLVQIAALTLEAEILGKKREYAKAIELLKKAIIIEDALTYNEPADWFFSIRHSLGHWLNESRNFYEAELIYRQDLETFPENGWALRGLQKSLKGQGKDSEAGEVKRRFDKAFKYADVKIQSSRFF